MNNTKIRDLGQVRELLTEWERVRARIVSGHVSGWFAVIGDTKGQESVYSGGVYQDDLHMATSAALKISAARVLMEDAPPSKPTLR